MAAYSSVCLIAVQTAVNAGDYLVSPQWLHRPHCTDHYEESHV